MDGRKAVAAGLLVLLTSTSCAPWGTLAVMGVVGEAAGSIPQVSESAGGGKVKVSRIFRDGAYTFAPAPPAIKRQAEKSFRSDPLADVALKKVSVKFASGGSSDVRLLAVAIVWSDLAASDPATWEGFLRGYGGNNGVEVRQAKLRGVEVAYGTQGDAKVVLVNYSRAVTLMVGGPPDMPFGPLKDLARYMLRGR